MWFDELTTTAHICIPKLNHDPLHTYHPTQATHGNLWPAPNNHFIALSFSAGQWLLPISASKCQSPGNLEKGGTKDPSYPHQHPNEGAKELLEHVGWDPLWSWVLGWAIWTSENQQLRGTARAKGLPETPTKSSQIWKCWWEAVTRSIQARPLPSLHCLPQGFSFTHRSGPCHICDQVPPEWGCPGAVHTCPSQMQ